MPTASRMPAARLSGSVIKRRFALVPERSPRRQDTVLRRYRLAVRSLDGRASRGKAPSQGG